jgi:hypothetical protein
MKVLPVILCLWLQVTTASGWAADATGDLAVVTKSTADTQDVHQDADAAERVGLYSETITFNCQLVLTLDRIGEIFETKLRSILWQGLNYGLCGPQFADLVKFLKITLQYRE